MIPAEAGRAAPFRNVLIVRLSSLGDVVFALPALEVLRARLPDARLTWVVGGDLSVIEEEVRALGYGDVEVWNAFGEVLP